MTRDTGPMRLGTRHGLTMRMRTTTSSKSRRPRTAGLSLFLIATTGLTAGCGGGDDAKSSTAAGIDRYCAGSAAAEAEGEKVFAGVDEKDPVALDKAERTMLAYVRAHSDADDVPAEIRADSQAFLDGYIKRVESSDRIQPTAEQEAAEKRLQAWEEKNCPKK